MYVTADTATGIVSSPGPFQYSVRLIVLLALIHFIVNTYFQV